MAAEVSADLTLINDEDTLRKMWSETEDFGKKKEIRARMYKIREQRLKDFYTTGEVGTEITTRKHATTRHTESIGDQGFLSMKTKEIRDSESPTRDFSRRGNNGYWSSVEERGYTTGHEDGALVERKEETKRGQGVVIEGNTETQLAHIAQNVHEKSEKADENMSMKAESVRQSSAMATSSVSKSGDTSSLVESSEKESSNTAKEEKTESSSSSSSTTKWSSSSSSKRVVSSSQSYQVTSGGERVIQDSSTKAITSGDNVNQQRSNVQSTTEKTVFSDVDQSNRAKLTESDLNQTNSLQKITLQKSQNSKATENEQDSQSFHTTQSSSRYSTKQSTEKEIRESQSQNVTESNKNLQEHLIRSTDQDQQNLHNVSTIRNEHVLTSTNKNLKNNQDLINLKRNEDNLIRSDIERQHRNESNEFITNEQYDTTNKNDKIVDTKQKTDHIVGRDEDYSRTDGSTVRETSKIIRNSSVQSNTDQKIMNEINKLDTFLSSQNTPVPSEPASPRGVTDGANWTVVSSKDGEFIYQNEKTIKDHTSSSKMEPLQPREKAPEPVQPKEKSPESKEPREKTPQSTEPREPMQSREMAPEHSLQPREKMIKHPSSLDLPKEATEGQYVTTYQHSYNRISVDNSPSHEFFVRTLRSSPDRLTPSPTKSSRGSLDRNSPDRRLRATSKGSLDRSSPETSKKRTYSKGSLERSSPDRPSRTSPGKTSERRGSNESYTIERRKDTTASHRNDSSIDFKKESSVERRKDNTLERRKQSRDKSNEINRSKTTERRGSNASYTIESRKDTTTKHRNDSSIDFKKDSTRDRRKDNTLERRKDTSIENRRNSNTDHRKDSSTDRRKDTSTDRRKSSIEKSNETNKSILNKDTKTKRKFSSTQQKTANKTRVSTPGVSPSASPTRRGLPKDTTSGSESELSQATYNKTTSVSSFRDENLITTTREDVVISENTDINQRKPSGQVKPRDKSPEYSSEGSVSRELKKTSLQPGHDVLPQGSAFKPITQEDSDTLSEDFITNERRIVSNEVRTTDERREYVHKQDLNETDAVDTSDTVIVRTEVVQAPPDVFPQKESNKSVPSTVRSTADTTVKKTTVSRTEDGTSSKGRSPHSSLERRPKEGPSPGKDSTSTKPTSAPSPQGKPVETLSRPISQPDTKTYYSSHSPSISPDRRPKAPQSTPTSVTGQDWGKSSPLSPANSPERRPRDSSHPIKTSRPEQPKFSKSPSVSPQRRPKESSVSPERRVTGSSPFSSPDRRRPQENTTSKIKSTRTISDTNKFITEEKKKRSKESPERSPTRRSGPYSSPSSQPRDRPERKLPSREKPRSHTKPQTGGRQPSSSPDSRTPSPKRTLSGPLRKPQDTPRSATVRRTTEVKETTRTGRRSSIPRAESKLSPRNSKDKIEPKSPATRTPSTATTIRKPTPVPKLNQVTRIISTTAKNTTKSTEKKPLPKSNLQRPTTVHKTPSSSSPTKIPSKSTVPKTPSDRKPRIPDTPTKASSQRTSKIDTVTKVSTRSHPTTPVKSTLKSGKPRKLLEPDVENYHSQEMNRIHTTHHVEQTFLKQERLLDLENENPPDEFYDDFDIETDDTGSPDRYLRPLREQNQVQSTIEETKKLKTTTVKASPSGKPSQPIGKVLPKATKTPVRPEKPSTLRNSTVTTKESSVTIKKSKQTKKPKVPKNLDSPTSSSSEEEDDDAVDAEEPDERYMKITRADDNVTTNITTTTASNQDLLSVIVQHPKSSRESSPGYHSVGGHFCTTSEDGESNPRYADFISEPEDVDVFDKTRVPSAPAAIKEECIDDMGSVADRVSVFESTRLSQEPSAPQAEPVQVLKPKSVLKTKTLFENIAKNQTSVQTSKPVDMGYPVPEEKAVQPSNESTDFISHERISYDEIDITERSTQVSKTAQPSTIKKSFDEPLGQESSRRPVQHERSPSPEGPKKAAPSETPDVKKPFERKPSGPVVNVSSKKDFFEKKVQDLTTTKTTPKVNDVAPSKLKPSPLFERKTYETDQSDTTDNVNRFDSDVTSSYMKSTVSSSVRTHTPEKLAKDSPRRPEEPYKPTKPSETAKQPSKPEEITRKPSRPEEITRKPSRPEEITRKPSKPEEISRKPSKPEEITRKPSKPEEITRTPSRPEEITRKPSRPEEITRKPSKPEELTRKPFKPEFTNAPQPVEIHKPSTSEISKAIKTETTEQRIHERWSPDRASKRPTVHESAPVKPGKHDEITSKKFKAHETTRNVTSQVSHRTSFEQDETVRRSSKPDDIRPSAYHSSPIEERRRIFKNDEVTRVSTEEYPRRGSQPEDVGRRPSRPDNVGRRPSQPEDVDESCLRQEEKSEMTTRTTVRTSETKEDRVGGKFGVTLRKTPSSTKVVVSKPTPQRQISKPGDVVDIESIFDLELLEEMLLKAVGYDERRSIRAQIRVVKKLIEEEKNNSVTNYTTSKTRTTSTNFQSSSVPSVRDIKNQQSSPLRSETQKTPDRRETREKSPTKTTSPERRPKATTASSPVKSSSRVTPERSPVRRASPEKQVSPERSPTRRASHEKTHLTNGYHTTTSSRTSETVSSVRSQTVRRSSNNEVKEGSGTDLITSSYGVGPTDEHGKPLFGLRALRRTSTNKTLIDETDTRVEESEDSTSLFGLKALQQTDTTMPAQANQLRELVERHQQYVRESSSKDLHQPVQKPKAKLRDSFILSQEEDAVNSAVSTSTTSEDAGKGLSLKSIIHKRETGGTVRSTMESSSTVVRSHSAVTSDGKVSLRRDVIHGEVSAKNGETPVGKVTRSTYSYQSPDGKQSSPSIQSSRTTKLIGGQRKSSGPKIEEITDSSTTDANRRYSKEYTVEEDEEETTSSSRQQTDRRRSSGYSEERTYTSILKNSTKDNDWTTSSKSDSKTTSSTTTRRSSGPQISEYTNENDEHCTRETKNLKSNIKSSSTDIPDSKTAFLAKQQNFSKSEDKTETQKKVMARGDSVKALQHKFQQATEAANQPAPRHYPKAGLILRTSSLHTSDENPPISSSLKQQQQQTNVERSDSRSRLESKETKSREIRTSTPVFSTEVTTQEDSQTVRTTAVSSPVVTSRVTKSVTTVRDHQQQQQSPSSFLDNTTKVSGVQDILTRMRNADLVSESGDTCEDAEARSLLNKFLGASVILQGMEQGMRAARSEVGPGGPVSPTSASLVIQAEKQRVKATSVRTQEDDIDDITDEKQLRILLDACSDYENRRRIRARLRSIMAETKGLSEDAEETHERSESSEVSRNDGTVVKTEVRTKTSSSARLTKANSVQSPFAKFRQLERQNSAPSVGRPGPPLFKLTDPKLVTSAATIKERLLSWVQAQTRDYKNVKIENFSTSWSNGLAFCALIHHFCPNAYDYSTLTPEKRQYNFELAFRIAEEEADIFPLLDVEDMVTMRRPDWKCVFTYVQSIYRRFHDSPDAAPVY